MSEVLYLYGFLPPGSATPPPDATGLEGRPVEVIDFGGFGAAVSRLPEAEYGESALAKRVGDLRWMAHRGLLHERIVTWFVDRDGILPVRFLTLHRGDESLKESAMERCEVIHGLLDRFRARREWNLKVTYEREALMGALGEDEPEIRELDGKIREASAGRRYLLQRRRDDLARERVDAIAHRRASDLIEEARAHADEVKVLPLQKVNGTTARIAAHAALLVARENEPALEAAVDRRGEALSARGMELHFSGPWAPYRFIEDTGLDGDDGRPDS